MQVMTGEQGISESTGLFWIMRNAREQFVESELPPGQLGYFPRMFHDVSKRRRDAATLDPNLTVLIEALVESLALIRRPRIPANITVYTMGKDDQVPLALINALGGSSGHQLV
jgi:hypothetical protein